MNEENEHDTLLGVEEGTTEQEVNDRAFEENVYTGARPKVRNIEDTTKRKKTRIISHETSIETSKEQLMNTGNGKSTDQKGRYQTEQDLSSIRKSRDTKCSGFFGIRSYVYEFYDSVRIPDSQLYDEFEDYDFRYLVKQGKKFRRSFCWKVAFWSGVMLLVFGVILLLLGHFAPEKKVVIGQKNNLEIIDRSAQLFNKNLGLCKVIGLVVFFIGFVIVLAVFILPKVVFKHAKHDVSDSEEGCDFNVAYSQQTSQDKIPASEKLTNVQPKRSDGDSVIMTNKGLCKIH
ncbi:uncharacterized protein LOC143254003 [Tachypleus tridentatus]|uniref:uncharacterized protein LOC143253998 n=1 Tax=Tachypleus tridentatus TaxID=6853 RepID=UPI003FD18064